MLWSVQNVQLFCQLFKKTMQPFSIVLPAGYRCISHECHTSTGRQTCLKICIFFQCIMDLPQKRGIRQITFM